MLRVEEGNLTEILNLLNNPVTKVNAQNKSGQTALSLAVRNGNFAVCCSLLAHGSNVNSRNKVNFIS
jgi:ankyrin repeat protein